VDELSLISRLPLKATRNALAELERTALLTFSPDGITFRESSLEGSEQLCHELAGKRSVKRPVPLPRPLLRHLARETKSSNLKTILSYAIRGLTLSRDGEVRSAGSVKATWIARVMQMSERGVRGARRELLEMGWLFPDEGSTQRKLNRDGAYFRIDTEWVGKAHKENCNRVIHRRREWANPSSSEADVNNSISASAACTEFAPPPVEKSVEFAPPFKDKKTLNRSNNQKTWASPNPSGVWRTKEERPRITNITREDLRRSSTVEELYYQAVRRGLIEASEASVINFLAAAARATAVEGDAPRVFMGIIRRKLWHHITQVDEDRAVSALKRAREKDSNRFRWSERLAA
jgi:hypothetical protein